MLAPAANQHVVKGWHHAAIQAQPQPQQQPHAYQTALNSSRALAILAFKFGNRKVACSSGSPRPVLRWVGWGGGGEGAAWH